MIGTPEDTSSGQRGSEGDVRRGSGFRRGRFPRRLAGIVAFVAVSLFATVWFSSGYLLEWLAGRILPDTLNVSGVSISWRGELLVGKVQASDAGGIWLELDGLKITPHWLRTLTGHPAVASLEISSVTVHRRPRPRMPLRIPVIPGWQRIPPCDHWEIRKLELAQPVAGYSAVYQLNGKIEQGENGLPLLTARLTDTSRQQITVTIGDSLNEPDKSVLLQVTCEGTDTQLLPGWLGTDQPVEVHVSGSGSRDKWAAEISVSAEAQQNLARFRIEASGYETVRYILQGEISGAPARVPYRFIQTAGGPTVVSVETEVDSKGGFRVHSLELNAPLCSVKASGSFHLLDHSLEMDCTASTADIGLLLDGLSAGEKTQQVPLPHDAVPATFSGRAFWRKDVFSLQGEGAASDRKILSLLLDRKGDGTIYGSGRIDLDAVPLPEQWRAIAGSGSVAFTAEGKAGDSGWQVSQVSLESSDWQIRGTATGSGINLLEDPLSGSFSFTAAGKEYAWGTLGQTRGSVSLEGIFKNALSFNVEADCTDGTVYGMRLDGVRLSAAGDIKPHSGTSWTDWLDNLQINLSGTSLVREAHALADPSMQFSAHWEENGRLMLKGVCSAAASRIEAAGTLRFQSGEVDLSGQVRVDFKDILNFSGTDQISAVDGLIEGAFHVARADWNTAPEVRFSAEATGITATEDVKPLDRLLTAIDRRIAGKGEVKVEQDQLSCIVHLEAPSLQRALASLALDLNTSNRDWTVELTSETYPEWIAGLWEGDSAGLKWIKEGKGLLKVKLGGTGTQQPDEIQAGCYWAVSARKRSPVQTIHGAARLSREQAGWTGEVAVQVQPANMDKSVGFSGGIFWKGGGISAPKIQVGFPASGWRKRDGFPLDPEAFALGNPIGLLAVSFSQAETNAKLTLENAEISNLLNPVTRGIFSGELFFRFVPENMEVKGQIAGTDLQIEQIAFDKGKITFEGHWIRGKPEKWQIRGAIESGNAGSKVRLGRQEFEAGTSGSDGWRAVWQLSGELDVGDTPGKYQLGGNFSAGQKSVEITVEKASGDFMGEAWRLTHPLVLRKDATGISWEKARAELDSGGFVEGAGSWKEGQISGMFSWKALPLGLAEPMFSLSGLQGLLEGNAEFSGDPSDLNGEMDLSVACWPSGGTREQAGITGNLILRRSAGGMTAWQASAKGVSSEIPVNIEFEGQGSSQFGLRPFKAELSGDHPVVSRIKIVGDLSYLGLLTGQDRFNLKGSLSGDIDWTRNNDRSRLSGNIKLQGGYFEDYRFGTILRAITCDAESNGDHVQITRIAATDGRGGSVQGEGTLKIGSGFWPELDMRLRLDRLRALRTDYAAAMISGEMQARGDIREPFITGQLVLNQGVIEAAMSPAGMASKGYNLVIDRPEDEKSKNGDSAVGENSGGERKGIPKSGLSPLFFSSRARCDLTLEVPGQLEIRAPVIQSVWRGRLTAAGPMDAVQCRGQLEIIRGHLNFFGKRLSITESKITMNERDLYRPYLMLAASGDAGDRSVQLRVEGEPGEMEMSVTASPSLPPDEALALLLFRRGAGQISPVQALQVARAASLLGRRFTMLQFLSGNFRIPGVDAFDIRTGETLSETSIGIGRSIGDRVYVQAEQGMSPDSGKVSAEVEVTPNIRVKVDAGANESGGGGVFWKKEY